MTNIVPVVDTTLLVSKIDEFSGDSRKVTLKALGKELGVHPTTVARWLSGETEIPSGKAVMLCRMIGIKVEDLYPDLSAYSQSLEQLVYDYLFAHAKAK